MTNIPSTHSALVQAIADEKLPTLFVNDPEAHWVNSEMLIFRSQPRKPQTVVEYLEILTLAAMRKKKVRVGV